MFIVTSIAKLCSVNQRYNLKAIHNTYYAHTNCIMVSNTLSENEFAEPSLSTNLIRCGAKVAPLLNEEFASKGIPVKPII